MHHISIAVIEILSNNLFNIILIIRLYYGIKEKIPDSEMFINDCLIKVFVCRLDLPLAL
jgi:hypothetical protein